MKIDTPPVPIYCRHHEDLPEGQARFYLDQYWQMHLYHDVSHFQVQNKWYEVLPGSLSLIPPAVDSMYRPSGGLSYEVVHFKYTFPIRPARICWHVGNAYEEARDSFERIARLLHAAPVRAGLHLWDLLLLVAPPDSNPTQDQTVRECMQWLSMRIHQQVSLSEMANHAGVSGMHLNRLFHRSVGQTAVSYFRSLKLMRVEHHLTHTLTPIKQVALDVGFTDLHAFNKWVRHHLGAAPREMRSLKAS